MDSVLAVCRVAVTKWCFVLRFHRRLLSLIGGYRGACGFAGCDSLRGGILALHCGEEVEDRLASRLAREKSHRAREAYYNGKPLIVDDMFDKVELKLRWYGSKYVVKYPRCSLRRQSTYADAEVDPSQVFALASVWLLFLGFGSSACIVPVIYTIAQAYQDAFNSGFSASSQLAFFAMLNGIIFMVLGTMIGYPIATASVGALQGLWKNDLVALKGACPNCGEEVFAFVRSKKSIFSPHRADCHVCESSLEFRTKVEQQSISRPAKRLVYGRIYLIRRRGRSRNQRWT